MSGFPSGAEIIVDERGSTALIQIDTDLYPQDIALKAAYWLTERCHVYVHRQGELLVAEVRTKDGASGEPLTAACGEFCNALIDFAVRARVATETAGIQEALLRRAFLELVPRAAE